MAAEVICVGTELLLGEILNSNARFLGQQLANLGIPHFYQTVVGDNPQRLKNAIAIACQRSSILIFTGGLGPTPDDLTVATLAEFFEVSLEERGEVLEDIQRKYTARGRSMSESNRKQALLPQGAEVLPNPLGTAPGMMWQPQPGLAILTFPGVPREMERMWHDTAVDFLRSLGWGQEAIYSQVLKFWGIPESTLAEKVADLLAMDNPTVAPYASMGEVRLRISARSASEAEALQLIEPVSQKVREMAGSHYFGSDEETLPAVVVRQLQERGETVAVAESCTGGGIGATLTEVPGASAVFLGGTIAYSNEVKRHWLQVSPEDLQTQGAVSAPVAEQMALGVRGSFGSHWGVSVTGIAGPGGGTLEKPVGLVYIGLAAPDGRVKSIQHRFGENSQRNWIRHASVRYAIDHLRRAMLSG
jgi:nicotinamide-nucleotide amidase